MLQVSPATATHHTRVSEHDDESCAKEFTTMTITTTDTATGTVEQAFASALKALRTHAEQGAGLARTGTEEDFFFTTWSAGVLDQRPLYVVVVKDASTNLWLIDPAGAPIDGEPGQKRTALHTVVVQYQDEAGATVAGGGPVDWPRPSMAHAEAERAFRWMMTETWGPDHGLPR